MFICWCKCLLRGRDVRSCGARGAPRGACNAHVVASIAECSNVPLHHCGHSTYVSKYSAQYTSKQTAQFAYNLSREQSKLIIILAIIQKYSQIFIIEDDDDVT